MSAVAVGMISLPTNPGDSTIVWSDDESRVRLERTAPDGWLLHTEATDEDEPYHAGVPSRSLGERMVVKLALALREHADLVLFQFIDIEAKGSTSVPGPHKPVKVARSRGWFVEMVNEGGLCDGDLAVRLNFKRPLSATEMLVFLKRLGMWADARTDEGWWE